ncbi:alginate lyase family protein [Actinoallomurus sp. NPDC050550]|uniref:alginate lyase family protein n=1 Tax=Actinoallomurus sp. NPDC050550 TaxID=3154937 RepID=UPI003409688B
MGQSRMSRRSVLGLTGGLAVVGMAGATGAGLLDGGQTTVGKVGAKLAKAPAKRFAHPGLLHTSADLKRMQTKVRAGAAPWQAGWKVLEANSHSRSGWKPRPLTTVYRGNGSPQNYGILYNDIHAAYQNALRWRITGDRAHGDTARDILNAWSATLKKVTGTSDRFLAVGIYGYEFANAAELMRGYPGFDLARFQTMMREVFYPSNDDFLKNHNGLYVTHYWANWDLAQMCSVLAIGILCDDPAKVEQAVTYFKHGAGNGSIRHVIPFLHPGGLGQWQESGRDQGHTTLGIGLMGTFCEMAWNQGYDLYGYDDKRFLKGCEYVAKYNLGHDVPFTTYTWYSGTPDKPGPIQKQTQISPGGRGNIRPVWELVYNHYVRRRGLHAPWTKAMAAKARPEGGGGNYGPNSGGFDQLGFGTLAFTR